MVEPPLMDPIKRYGKWKIKKINTGHYNDYKAGCILKCSDFKITVSWLLLI